VAAVPNLNHIALKTVLVLLVVDASAVTLNALALILQQNGYSVLTAGNSKDALHQLASKPVDLAIVDHYTVEEERIDLPAAIKQLRPRTPVLMLSSQYPVESSPAGVDIFLSKVEPPARVLDAVASLLSKPRQL
jgi:DNA-binding NarL/FixJ family response regulator